MKKYIFYNLLTLLIITGCEDRFPSSTETESSTLNKTYTQIVADKKTNLIWMDSLDAKDTTKTFDNAIKYCKDLKLNGHSNWRIPTIQELYTIVKYDRANPAIENNFNHVSSSAYWSSDNYSLDENLKLGINFYDGSDGVSRKNRLQHIRCVEGDYLTTHSFNKVNNIVIDNNTNLQWQDTNNTKNLPLTYSKADAYCKSLTLENRDDWRVPNIKELRSIVNRDMVIPTINQNFSNSNDGFYWTSTEYEVNNEKVWTIFFTDGNDYQRSKNDKAYIRCVR